MCHTRQDKTNKQQETVSDETGRKRMEERKEVIKARFKLNRDLREVAVATVIIPVMVTGFNSW